MLTPDRGWLTIQSVGASEQDLTVHNLTVAGLHTLYVSKSAVLVHNDREFDLTGASEWTRGKFPVAGALDSGGPAKGVLFRTQNGVASNYAVDDAGGIILRRVDLVGWAHGGVPTPHTQQYCRDVTPDGRVFPAQSKFALPAGRHDIPC